jgi:glutathione S-transferase
LRGSAAFSSGAKLGESERHIDSRHAAKLERELTKDVAPGHVLFGRVAKALNRPRVLVAVEVVSRARIVGAEGAMRCSGVADLTLYDYWFSGNGWKVRTLFRHLGRPFVIRWVDILRGEQHEAWFRAKNPVGQIPVVEQESGQIWTESNAILETMAEGTSLLPEGHLRHRVRAWLNFEQTWVDGVISRARFRRVFPAVLPTPETFFASWDAEGRRALQILDEHLRSTEYMVANRFTVADIGLYAYVHVAQDGGFRLDDYPSVTRWLQRVAGERGILPMGMNPEGPEPSAVQGPSGRPGSS